MDYSDGAKLEGIWREGIRNGQFHKIYPNGKEYLIDYQDDIKVKEEEVEKVINIE